MASWVVGARDPTGWSLRRVAVLTSEKQLHGEWCRDLRVLKSCYGSQFRTSWSIIIS